MAKIVMARCFLLLLGIAWSATLLAQTSTPMDNPREMLRVMQIDDSLLDQFLDDRPVDASEQEPLLRLLFRLPSFAQVDVDRWTIPFPESQPLEAIRDQQQFAFLRVKGIVRHIERHRVLPELVQRLGFSDYYQLQITHDNHTSVVFVRQLPIAWLAAFDAGTAIQEPVQIQGLLLKKQILGDQPALVFAAPRVHWYPTTASQQLRVTEDLLLLANMGVDISPFAQLQHRTTMQHEDREPFYQMLNAVHHAEHSQFEKLGHPQFDIRRMLEKPDAVVGQLYALEGTARRAIRIEVPDRDIRARYGIDHYFEVEVFMPMERSVRFVNGEQARVFQDYPFVFCVPELPPDMPLGDDIRVQVRTTGFFLKLWAYRTEFMSEVRASDNRPAQQFSPLLIGPTILPARQTPPQDSQLSLFVAILFVVSLAVIWIVLWRAGIHDRRRAQELFAKNLPPDGSLQDLQEN